MAYIRHLFWVRNSCNQETRYKIQDTNNNQMTISNNQTLKRKNHNAPETLWFGLLDFRCWSGFQPRSKQRSEILTVPAGSVQTASCWAVRLVPLLLWIRGINYKPRPHFHWKRDITGSSHSSSLFPPPFSGKNEHTHYDPNDPITSSCQCRFNF